MSMHMSKHTPKYMSKHTSGPAARLRVVFRVLMPIASTFLAPGIDMPPSLALPGAIVEGIAKGLPSLALPRAWLE